MSLAGERVELARYQRDSGERILVGQRVNGAVAVADVPAGDHGRVYLVERRVESKADLDGLIAAYVADSRRRGEPAARRPTADKRAKRASWLALRHPAVCRAYRRLVAGHARQRSALYPSPARRRSS